MKYFPSLALLGLAVISVGAFCQSEASKTVRAGYVLPRVGNLSTSQMVIGLPSNEKSGVLGNPYWDNRWNKAAVLLATDTRIEGHLARYDIFQDEIEFLDQQQVRVLPGSRVKNMNWLDSLTEIRHYFVRASEFKEDGQPVKGFLEVLVEGNSALLKKISVDILAPDFNVALNVGRKESKIIKKTSYYCSVKNDLFRIKSLKDFRPLFQERSTEMDAFIKKEKIKNKEQDLIKILTYFNSLK